MGGDWRGEDEGVGKEAELILVQRPGERPSHKPAERGDRLPKLLVYSGVVQWFLPNELTIFFQNYSWTIHLF